MSQEIPRSLREQASRQSGVITRRQALDSGLPLKAVEWKLATGAWLQVYRGVYMTAGPVTRNARLWAAVLYAGRGAYLSHETAAELGRLTDVSSPAIHVIIPADRRVVPPEGVIIHRSSQPEMVWRPPWFPPYSIAEQTVIDLVQEATDQDAVVSLITAGFNRKLLTADYFRRVADSYRKLRWRRELDEIVTAAAGGTAGPGQPSPMTGP